MDCFKKTPRRSDSQERIVKQNPPLISAPLSNPHLRQEKYEFLTEDAIALLEKLPNSESLKPIWNEKIRKYIIEEKNRIVKPPQGHANNNYQFQH